MERLTILVGRLYKSIAPTNYFFKVQLVGRLLALVGVIRRPVESPLYSSILYHAEAIEFTGIHQNECL